jgi:hypothetical protein
LGIAGEEGDALRQGLSHQQAVEGVFVQGREAVDRPAAAPQGVKSRYLYERLPGFGVDEGLAFCGAIDQLRLLGFGLVNVDPDHNNSDGRVHGQS